jgi:ferredoxin
VQFTDAGFVVFNRHYVERLAAWGIFRDEVNPVARSNVCPEIDPPTAPSFYALRELLKTLPGSRSHICYSAPKPTDRPDIDFDRVGRVGVRVLEEIGVPPDADFYICGPAAFMSGLVDGLAGWGVTSDRLHTENFGSGPPKTPGIAAVRRRPPHPPTNPPAEAAEGGPLVSFTRSNLAVHWGSAFHSLLELAEACDVPVRWSCRTGVCHNCETGLISGSVTYRPEPVEPPAAGNLLICCSQPQGDIALDL